jgi:uncharacterized protein (DUF433 family)
MVDITPIQHVEMVDGEAMIRGRRVKAKMVASMVVNAAAAIDEVMEQYEISRAAVYAALAYYYDHQDAIEQEFRDAEAYVKKEGISAVEHLEQLRARLAKQNPE